MFEPLIREASRLHRDGAPWSAATELHWTRDARALREFYRLDRLPALLCTVHSLRQGFGPCPYKAAPAHLWHRFCNRLCSHARSDWGTLATGMRKAAGKAP